MTAKKATVAPKKTVAVKETPVKAAEAVKEAVKEAPVKEAPVKEETVKAEKAPAKKAAAPEIEVYVQFWGKEVFAKEVKENILKIWTDEMGHKMDELKDLKIYIKPEDNGAHYVFNGEITGFLAL